MLQASNDQKCSEIIEELAVKHDQELRELRNQHEQEMLALKSELMKHEMVGSHMTESVIPAAVTVSMHHKSAPYSTV
jgi:hypothetical protein